MRWVVGTLLLASACAQQAEPEPAPNEIAKLAGVWDSGLGMGYWGLQITENGTVQWIDSGSEGKEEGESRGVFRDGKLHLEPPMRQYQGGPVPVLHYRIERGREYLLMDVDFELLADDVVNRNPPPPDMYYGARRRLSQADLENYILNEEREAALHQLFEEFLASPLTEESIALLEQWAKEGGEGPVGVMAAQCLQAMITNDHAQELSEELQKKAAEAMDRVLIEED